MTSYQRHLEAFRYIAENVKEYKIPESLEHWRRETRKTISYRGKCKYFNSALDRRMNNIARKFHADGYTFLEKVHLVFVFSWEVSDTFVKIVQEAKCTIKLDRNNRIKYFRSEDGSVVLSSDHNEDEKFFKGTLLTAKRQRSLLSAGNSKEFRHSQPTDPEPADDTKENDPESDSEDEAPTNVSDSQNSEYSKIQNGLCNGRINYNELDEQELEDVTVLKHLKITNGRKEATPQEQMQENKAPEMKEEINRNTSTNEKSNIKPEEDVDLINGSLQREASFNGQINYDNGEHPEFIVPVGYQLLDNQNKRHLEPSQEHAKRLKIEKSRESGLVDSPEINGVKPRNEEVEEAPEKIPEDSIEPTSRVTDESDIQNQVAEDKDHDDNQTQNLVQNNEKRVKIEDFLEEMQQEQEVIILDQKPEMPPPGTISLLKLAKQIDILAFNINLEDCFQEKALRAVRLFKAKNQAVPIHDFNQVFNVFLASLKRGTTRSSNENSMQLSRIFKHLQRNLIGPLGDVLMTEALGILDDEIQKLEGNEEKVPLKTVQSKIDCFMHFITSVWTDLDE
ncbi:unnamed protein product [Caenorhabditis nigoni]